MLPQDAENYRDHPLLPEVPSIGWGIFRRAAIGGPRPSGGGAYEICYIDRGSSEWWIDEVLYEVGPGSLLINRPGEWHGGHNAMFHPCEVFWVQIRLSEHTTLPALTRTESRQLLQDFTNLHYRFFPASPEIKDHFRRLLNEYRYPGAYARLTARATLHELMICVLRDHARQQAHTPSPEIRLALSWMDQHSAEKYTLDEVAAVAGVSTGYFHKLFLEETGFTPGEYRMRQRVYQAKHLLRNTTMPITEIAHQLNFSTSQYFATVFKKLAGMSPSDYRELTLERQR